MEIDRMKREKTIILTIILIALMIIEFILFNQHLFSYSIIVMPIIIILTIYLITYIYENRDEQSIYKSKLKRALKNYDAILVESQRFPDLKGKNIIRVTNMDDLIDAQIEIRKPIYYMIENETSCSFVLLDTNEACVYILKQNEEVTSPLELIIAELEKKNHKDDDSSLLEDIEKTTIIKLKNKTLKVSPYRKNKDEKKEESKEKKKNEDIEIL
jgi:hypothetical protein